MNSNFMETRSRFLKDLKGEQLGTEHVRKLLQFCGVMHAGLFLLQALRTLQLAVTAQQN